MLEGGWLHEVLELACALGWIRKKGYREARVGVVFKESGSEGVMNFRAAYLSSGSCWKDFWNSKAA